MSDEAIHREELRLARQLARAALGVSLSARPDSRSHGINMIVGSKAVKDLQEALDALGDFYRSMLLDAPTEKQPFT